MTRRLAYRSTPGESHTEAAWVKARCWISGKTQDEVKAEIEREIAAGRLIVTEEGT